MRGLGHLKMEGLTALSVLTGPNGCGKSTVLDALLLAASNDPAAGFETVMSRRPVVSDPARWLLGIGLEYGWIDAGGRRFHLMVRAADGPRPVPPRLPASVHKLAEIVHARPHSGGWVLGYCLDGGAAQVRHFRAGEAVAKLVNAWEILPSTAPAAPTQTRLIDPSQPISLVDRFSEVVRAGRKREVEAHLAGVLGSTPTLDILTEDGAPVLYLTDAAAVPVGLAGDGVQASLQVALELAALPKGALALVEEPEVFHHPRALAQTARSMVSAARRGVQVVLTTHSAELIDALVAALGEDVSPLSVHLLGRGVDQKVRARSWTGEEAQRARAEIEADLR